MMPEQLNTAMLVEHAGALYRHVPLFQSHGGAQITTTTCGDVLDEAARIANLLREIGCRPGDTVGTFAWNSVVHMAWYLAVPSSSLVLHTMNIRMAADELAFTLTAANDRVIAVDHSLWKVFTAIELPRSVETVVVFGAGSQPVPAAHQHVKVVDWDIQGPPFPSSFDWVNTDESSASGICFTSGTSGRPKGVVYSHRSTYLHALSVCTPNAIGLSEEDVVLPAVPMFHANGWGVPYAALVAGASLAMPGRHLDAFSMSELIHFSSVTVSIGVPTLWQSMIDAIESGSADVQTLASLERVVVGGSALGDRLTKALDKCGVQAIHGWGMTEMSPVGTISSHSLCAPIEIRRSQGRPLPGVRLALLSEDGNLVPHDGKSIGELLAGGLWVANEYLGPADDRASFEIVSGRRWLRTGDVAKITPDGYVYLVDRSKDLIKSGGEWIAPSSLERAIEELPGIRQAAVVGVPDDKWGERPHGVVVLDAGTAFDQARARLLLAELLPTWQIPDAIHVVEEIPLTTVGKIDKLALRQALNDKPRQQADDTNL